VLVIDDDSGIRDSLAECLEVEGYAVACASNGADGLERLRAERPNLILVDLLMPVMNGYQFLAEVRGDPALKGLPVVLMTGSTPRAGHPLPEADAMLPKPFELDELLSLVRRFAG
jgi:two-component system chemotaxis response regulator CheY